MTCIKTKACYFIIAKSITLFLLLYYSFLYSIQILKKIRNSRTVFFYYYYLSDSKISNSHLRRKTCPDAPRLLGLGSESGSNATDVTKFIKQVCECQVTLAFNLTEAEHLMKFAYIDPTGQY